MLVVAELELTAPRVGLGHVMMDRSPEVRNREIRGPQNDERDEGHGNRVGANGGALEFESGGRLQCARRHFRCRPLTFRAEVVGAATPSSRGVFPAARLMRFEAALRDSGRALSFPASHALPSSAFWEAVALRRPMKHLILLASRKGAALPHNVMSFGENI